MNKDCRVMLAISFLWANATAGPMAVLPLILRDGGIGMHEIGIIMGANTAAVILGTLLSGWASSRYGALRVVIAAILCAALSLVSFEWTAASAVASVLSRLLQGIGFGLFLTAGILFVQANTPGDQQTYAVGLFSAMAIAPYFYAQLIAELYLDHFGSKGIFLAGAAPFIVALIAGLYLLPRAAPIDAKPKSGSYRDALRNPRVYPGYFSMLVNGLLFGFGASFMPIMLRDASVMLGMYFTPFAVTALASRFFLLGRLEVLPKTVLLACGMGLMSIACLMPTLFVGVPTVLLSGIVYGLAYSAIGPTTFTITAQLYPSQMRSRPVALVNTFFQIGSILSPIAASYAAGAIGLPLFMGMIGALSFGMCLWLQRQFVRALQSPIEAH